MDSAVVMQSTVFAMLTCTRTVRCPGPAPDLAPDQGEEVDERLWGAQDEKEDTQDAEGTDDRRTQVTSYIPDHGCCCQSIPLLPHRVEEASVSCLPICFRPDLPGGHMLAVPGHARNACSQAAWMIMLSHTALCTFNLPVRAS